MRQESGIAYSVLFIGLILLLSAGTGHSYTSHSGIISSNETWSAGTHYVSGTVTVSDGVTLTISAGAVVKFFPIALSGKSNDLFSKGLFGPGEGGKYNSPEWS